MKRVPFTLEFLLRSSPHIVHEFLTAPDCLIRWFCDKCDNIEECYTFVWDGNEEIAYLVEDVQEERVRYRWEDADEGEYFEFKIITSEVTGETVVEVTAFADQGDEKMEKQYWTNKIEDMKRAMGA